MRNRFNRRREASRKARFEKQMDELVTDIEEFAENDGDVDHLVKTIREDIDDYLAADAGDLHDDR